jgi:hypothetical protein
MASKQTTYSQSFGRGFPGQRLEQSGDVVETVISEESSAEIPFGLAVCWGTGDREVLLPATENDVVAGLVIHSHDYAKDSELGDSGLKPGVMFTILRRGKMIVTAEEATTAHVSRLWVRAVAGGGEVLGALEVGDDSTDMIDATGQGLFRETTDAGGLTVIEVDFTNEA